MDPGPTYFARAPVFGVPGLKGKLIGLEFGCEADFIAENSPKPITTEQIDGNPFDVYRIDDGGDAVEILERSHTSLPVFARYYHQGTLTMVLHYDAYETGLADEPTLFTAPSVRYTEVSAH